MADFILVEGKSFQQQIDYIAYLLNYISRVNSKLLSYAYLVPVWYIYPVHSILVWPLMFIKDWKTCSLTHTNAFIFSVLSFCLKCPVYFLTGLFAAPVWRLSPLSSLWVFLSQIFLPLTFYTLTDRLLIENLLLEWRYCCNHKLTVAMVTYTRPA